MYFWFMFWLISSTVCIILTLLVSMAMTAELKREYTWKKSKTSIPETIMIFIKCFIPFYNILIILICLFGHDMTKKKLLETGRYTKREEIEKCRKMEIRIRELIRDWDGIDPDNIKKSLNKIEESVMKEIAEMRELKDCPGETFLFK